MLLFLHIGENVSVLAKDIIFILDLESINAGIASREFVEICQDEGLVTVIGPGDAKSLILTSKQAYLSPISSLTLAGRSKQLQKLTTDGSQAAKS